MPLNNPVQTAPDVDDFMKSRQPIDDFIKSRQQSEPAKSLLSHPSNNDNKLPSISPFLQESANQVSHAALGAVHGIKNLATNPPAFGGALGLPFNQPSDQLDMSSGKPRLPQDKMEGQAPENWQAELVNNLRKLPFVQSAESLIHPTKPYERAETIGENLGPIAAFGAAGKLGETKSQPLEGLNKIEKASNPKVGKAGKTAQSFRNDLDTAKEHLSKIARDTPDSSSFLERTLGKGDPEWYSETAGNISDYKDQLWDKEHTEPVTRQKHQLFNYNNKVIEDATKEIDTQDDQDQSAKAIDWIHKEIPRIKTVGEADSRIRRLNAEIKSLPETYGPVGARVRLEALKSIRENLDQRLSELGESGVKKSNKEWGSLRNIEDRLRERYFQETGKAAKSSPIPDWFHLYGFGGIHGASLGAGLRLGSMLKPSPSVNLVRGMRELGKSGMEPTPPVRPSTYQPGPVPRAPIGLLPPVGGFPQQPTPQPAPTTPQAVLRFNPTTGEAIPSVQPFQAPNQAVQPPIEQKIQGQLPQVEPTTTESQLPDIKPATKVAPDVSKGTISFEELKKKLKKKEN